MRTLVVAVVLSLLALPAIPQQKLVESIEVRIANIDVVVRDRSGKPVTGLTKADFELREDGIPQPITNFYEVTRAELEDPRSQEVPLERRQRRTVVFVDASSLAPARSRDALAAVRKYIDEKTRPEDRTMLVVWRLGLHVVTPFTNDRETLHRGLEAVARYGPAGVSTESAMTIMRGEIDELYRTAQLEQNKLVPLLTWDNAYVDARTRIERYAHELHAQQDELLDALTHVTSTIAGLEGKKILLFVGEHFAQYPATELYRYVDDKFAMELSRNTVRSIEMATGTSDETMPALIREFARDASANGVTVYAIGAAPGAGDFADAGVDDPLDHGYGFSRDANTSAALQTIAEMTGGVALTRTSNFDLAFDTIERDLASYYSLGYRPTGLGMKHDIRVTASNPQYVVRARQSDVTKSTDEEMEDRVVANVYTEPAKNDWPIVIHSGAPQADGRNFVFPVQIEIPSTLTLLPEDEQSLGGSFTMYFVVGDEKGSLSPVLRRPERLKVGTARAASVRAKPMIYRTAFRVRPGHSTLSVAIIDQLSGSTGFARTKIVVP